MQNKGFVTVFAILLAVVCCFYLSFSYVTRQYDQKAVDYATGYASKEAEVNTALYDHVYSEKYSYFLDSISEKRVWMTFSWLANLGINVDNLGYTLKECQAKEIGLGLDLKGGMSVIVELDVAAVLRSLGNVDNTQFTEALNEASVENSKGSGKDYITLFVEKFKAKNGEGKLGAIFANKLKDTDGDRSITATDKDEVVISALRAELQSAADNSFTVLRRRIDGFGVVAPNIQKLDKRAERIMIELPGIKEPERVRKLLQGNANLEFWKTYDASQLQSTLSDLDRLSSEALAQTTVSDSTSTDSLSLAKPQQGNLKFKKSFLANFAVGGGGAIVGLVNKSDTAAVNDILHRYSHAYSSDLKFAWAFKAQTDTLGRSLIALYSLRGDGTKKGPALTGDVVKTASADQSHRGSAWEVGMQMDSQGSIKWAQITGAEKGRSIAIVLDGYVYSAPNVNDKIEGGRSSITGNFTVEEAKDLENVLKSGKMRAGVRIIQEDIVGPSLGQEAIDSGLLSFALALLIVMVYMCVAYGIIPGLVANGALLLNLFITMAALASIGAVMTLPGLTGLVLSLGMAVDANVLIYERTKEELRAGKNVKTAIADGYKHAFSAIFDSNLTSIITAAILIKYGTGAIQGFATTLIIGIAASFFTAVYLTRLFYTLMIEKGKFRNLTFVTPLTKNLFVNTNINFLGMTKKATILTVACLALGAISIFFVNGLNSGIDFTGGRNYTVRFDKSVSTAEIEKLLAPEFDGAVRVISSGSAQATTSSSQVRVTTNYKIADESSDVEAEIKGKMATALKDYIAPGKTINDYVLSSQKVGGSIADDMKADAFLAVGLAVLCMALYILFRFRDVAFSVGTFVAVAHDAIMVVFFYSLLYKIMPFSMEVDQSFIAAVLTVVGYSINDKVVIFDRIRELRNMYPKRAITETINESLNSTLGRTINTSFSTLLGVLCIFLLGGDTIRSFTFAIFIGIVIGTYSSLFVATPITWGMLRGKERKAAVEAEK